VSTPVGFSQSTSLPVVSASRATSYKCGIGTEISTASTSSRAGNAARSMNAVTTYRSASPRNAASPVPISPSRIGGIVGAAMPRPSSSSVPDLGRAVR
jgi:hypothetical protein